MILSVSRRTDVPYFYHDWFLDKVKKGEIKTINPYNQKISTYRLDSDNIEAIVFWTKDASKFFETIKELDTRGLNYYFQYTLNNYPDLFEKNVRKLEERIDTFIKLSKTIGKDRVIWRYDPIIASNITNIEYHKKTFYELCEKLHKHTNRVVISYLDIYGKLAKNLKRLEEKEDIKIVDICNYKKSHEDLSLFLKETANTFGLEIESCSEQNLEQYGINKGKCVDGDLINTLFQTNTKHTKDRGQRTVCGCVQSVDVGTYISCIFDCVYCYSNTDDETERKGIFKKHLPSNDFISQ